MVRFRARRPRSRAGSRQVLRGWGSGERSSWEGVVGGRCPASTESRDRDRLEDGEPGRAGLRRPTLSRRRVSTGAGAGNMRGDVGHAGLAVAFVVMAAGPLVHQTVSVAPSRPPRPVPKAQDRSGNQCSLERTGRFPTRCMPSKMEGRSQETVKPGGIGRHGHGGRRGQGQGMFWSSRNTIRRVPKMSQGSHTRAPRRARRRRPSRPHSA